MSRSKTTTKNPQYRQGDVLITAVDTLPTLATPIPHDPRGLVLAEGEMTGHAHVIALDAITEAVTDGAASYFSVRHDAGAVVTHQEHDSITLPPGQYRAIRQREYAPEAIRNVQD